MMTPAPSLAEFLRQRIRSDEGNRDEQRIHLDLVRELDEFRDRLVGRDRHHGFRLALHDIEQRRLHRGGIALERARGDQRHVALGQRALHAVEAGKPEGIVLIEDRDLGDAEILGQMLDPGLGLLKIRGADIDDIAVVRIAQKFGAGERADERHLCGSGDRLTGFRCRRSDRADHGEDFVCRR